MNDVTSLVMLRSEHEKIRRQDASMIAKLSQENSSLHQDNISLRREVERLRRGVASVIAAMAPESEE